jgi:hypothetical protein
VVFFLNVATKRPKARPRDGLSLRLKHEAQAIKKKLDKRGIVVFTYTYIVIF